MKTKICTKCKLTKPLSDFHKCTISKDTFAYYCKKCTASYAKKYNSLPEQKVKAAIRRKIRYQKEDKEYRRKQQREWRNTKGGRRKYLNSHLKALYGITLEQYEKMFEEQNGVCAICKQPEINRRLSIDHRHSDGIVRALLCTKCNYLVGIIESSFWGLKDKVFDYIERHNG